MSEIQYQKLDTLLKYLPKSKIKAGEGKEKGKYPFFKSGADQSKFIDIAIFDGESLIIGDGGNANINYFNGKFSTSDHCYVIQKKDDENIDLKYVYYFLKTNIHILEAGFKGAGLKNISKKYISNIKIPIIKPVENQRKISTFLTRLEELIAKRKESIKLLDELVKSTFLDMFGDPVLNPNGWETKTIEKLVKSEPYAIKRGPFGGALKKEIFVDDGYLVYEQYHALNNDFSMARYFIDEKKFNELKGFEVKAGDIIISCSGVYLGKLAIVPQGARKGIINQALLKISLDENKMKNIAFTHIFTNENFRNKFFGANRGAGIPNFPPMKDFKKFLFITPPIELQNKFADIVIKIENTKKLYQKSLDELTNLFNSTAQKAFKGELDVSKIAMPKTSKVQKTDGKKKLKKDLQMPKASKLLSSSWLEDKMYKATTLQSSVALSSFFKSSQELQQKLQERKEHIDTMLQDIPQIKQALEDGVLSKEDFLELPLRFDFEYKNIKKIIMHKLATKKISQICFDDKDGKTKIKLVKTDETLTT